MAPKVVMKAIQKKSAASAKGAAAKPKSKALTEGNLKKHQDLLAKGASNEKDALELFNNLDSNSKQCLWKHFELQRKSMDVDAGFQSVAGKGAGSMGKKMKLMAGFIMDKGNIGSNYQSFYQSVSVTKSQTYEESWLSMEKALSTWGKNELYERVKSGTIEMRKNPKDPRFPEFREEKVTKKVNVDNTRNLTMGGQSQVGVTDMMAFFNQPGEDMEWDGFALENQSSSSKDNPLSGLGKMLGIKDKTPKPQGQDKDKEEMDRIETLSCVGKDDGVSMIQGKFVGMKKTLVKYENALQSIPDDKQDEKTSKQGSAILQALGKSLAALNDGINNKNLKKGHAKTVLATALAVVKKAKAFNTMMKEAEKE
jgi:hypothetical protein